MAHILMRRAKVMARLMDAGFAVRGVQNPLTSFEDDVATTRRALDAAQGPIVLVGHSYGGAVITEAAAGRADVKALVYIAAHAPDAGEKIADLRGRFGPAPLGAHVRTDATGFMSIDPAGFRAGFAADVPEAETRILAATQKPIAAACFQGVISEAAWRTIPAWYLVTTEDQAIKTELQRFMAERMGAKTREIAASHAPYISQPEIVAEVIMEAAG